MNDKNKELKIKKKDISEYIKSLPFVINYFKDHLEKNAPDAFESGTSLTNIIIRLFGQQLIDDYFDQKLDDFGFKTYFKASFKQIEESLKINTNYYFNSSDSKQFIYELKSSLEYHFNNFDENNYYISFNPQNNPVIKLVRNTFETFLKKTKFPEIDILSFIKHFNENIENQVIEQFGEDIYKKHIQDLEETWRKKNEVRLLEDQINFSKIGFEANESLKYEETLGKWEDIVNFTRQEEINYSYNDYLEKDLIDIKISIEEYFTKNPNDNLKKVLFLISDFGNGKSVFFKNYACSLAKHYLIKGEGYFPIYFNLKDFQKYSGSNSLGVINNYLEDNYAIKINNEYFKNKNYIFLIDSLDECGDLTSQNLKAVISSVKQIQSIDKEKSRLNRIVIASRPIQSLKDELSKHEPKTEISNNKKIYLFLSVFGFKKDQFNDWFFSNISSLKLTSDNAIDPFVKYLIEKINMNQKLDIYQELLNKKILSVNELKKPIFAYILYKLISNYESITHSGKVGLYLSFINFLTKEAKYIYDLNNTVNLESEYNFRNILHNISKLWLFNRTEEGNLLKKADILRTIQGNIINVDDEIILEMFNKNKELKPLSLSYFGENEKLFFFSHQSFSEILLAEYYLKIFIKYSLDETLDIEQARISLIFGNLTDQSANFFLELLYLLNDTSSEKMNDEILKKRKLLFPILASMAVSEKKSNFFSKKVSEWYKIVSSSETETSIPKVLLENWVIKPKDINKIINLALKILNSKDNYLVLKKDKELTSIFNMEIIKVNKKLSEITPDIDKWLSLLVGEILFTDIFSDKYFIREIENYLDLYSDLTKNWNFTYGEGTPSWSPNPFIGIDMSNFNYLNTKINNQNFSNSNFEKANFYRSELNNSIFLNSNLEYARFIETSLIGSNFSNTNLTMANFERAFLQSSKFPNAILAGTSFREAILTYCDFTGAIFSRFEEKSGSSEENKSLEDEDKDSKDEMGVINFSLNLVFSLTIFHSTDFFRANLEKANFQNQNLEESNFFAALFFETDIRGANLSKVTGLDKAIFLKAIYNDETIFPELFDPTKFDLVKKD